VNSSNKDLIKHVDISTSEFYRKYNFFSKQQLPEVGDHVYKINSHNREKFEEFLYIVDAVLEPGIVIGRRLLSDGKSYGKTCCLNAYSHLKVDENQLISKLIENNHDYMKEQQDKNKEKRRQSAKIDRYNKKISIDVRKNPREALEMLKNSKPGDVFYSGSMLRHLKKRTIIVCSFKENFLVYQSRWSGTHSYGLDTNNIVTFSKTFPRFLSKEKPIDYEDIEII